MDKTMRSSYSWRWVYGAKILDSDFKFYLWGL